MALPLSGQISMGMIRTELGIPNQSPFSLRSALEQYYVDLNPFSPYLPSESKLSSWYGYDHTSGGGGLPSGSYEMYLSWGETQASSCIGFMGIYYTDASTLEESTVLYTEYGQTDPLYLAQAGWYSDGFYTVYWDGSSFVGGLLLCGRRVFTLFAGCFGEKLGDFYLDGDDFLKSSFVYTDQDLKNVYKEYEGVISDNSYNRTYSSSKGLGEVFICKGK